MKSTLIKTAFIIIFFFIGLTAIMAQPGGPGGGPGAGDGTVGSGVEVPINGGAIFMLIAGLVYGIIKLRGNKNKTSLQGTKQLQ
ncbi:MAG: hypothetical protein HGB12_11420 [Bacteroidetes bacterium]|nr:hypothetical protein [Bacteroidota bacterium]